MKLNIFIERENKSKTITFSKSTVKDLLSQLKINTETVIVVRTNESGNKEVLTEDDQLNDQEKIQLLSVISGG
ncbi:MoaD/ThiS family protein [Candidatus Woesearchaeota archaeon]|nr:MoaD/ThiS family protein [Candidatus Woesearchaeota archaeon]